MPYLNSTPSLPPNISSPHRGRCGGGLFLLKHAVVDYMLPLINLPPGISLLCQACTELLLLDATLASMPAPSNHYALNSRRRMQ